MASSPVATMLPPRLSMPSVAMPAGRTPPAAAAAAEGGGTPAYAVPGVVVLTVEPPPKEAPAWCASAAIAFICSRSRSPSPFPCFTPCSTSSPIACCPSCSTIPPGSEPAPAAPVGASMY
eukprot:scaffold149797_cov15-Tisochrysis_lutea.AAC.1